MRNPFRFEFQRNISTERWAEIKAREEANNAATRRNASIVIQQPSVGTDEPSEGSLVNSIEPSQDSHQVPPADQTPPAAQESAVSQASEGEMSEEASDDQTREVSPFPPPRFTTEDIAGAYDQVVRHLRKPFRRCVGFRRVSVVPTEACPPGDKIGATEACAADDKIAEIAKFVEDMCLPREILLHVAPHSEHMRWAFGDEPRIQHSLPDADGEEARRVRERSLSFGIRTLEGLENMLQIAEGMVNLDVTARGDVFLTLSRRSLGGFGVTDFDAEIMARFVMELLQPVPTATPYVACLHTLDLSLPAGAGDSRTRLGADGCRVLADLLCARRSAEKALPRVARLLLAHNQIGDEGCAALVEALAPVSVSAETLVWNATLTELDLSGNGITTDGAKRLAAALEPRAVGAGAEVPSADDERDWLFPSSLRALRLARNEIRAEGAAKLAEALLLPRRVPADSGTSAQEHIANATIAVLDLAGAKIGARGAIAIVTALQPKTGRAGTQARACLTELRLGDETDGVPPDVAAAANDLLTAPPADGNDIVCTVAPPTSARVASHGTSPGAEAFVRPAPPGVARSVKQMDQRGTGGLARLLFGAYSGPANASEPSDAKVGSEVPTENPEPRATAAVAAAVSQFGLRLLNRRAYHVAWREKKTRRARLLTPETPSCNHYIPDEAELEVIEKEVACVVCTDPCVLPTSIDGCGHTFCLGCISQWMTERAAQCPVCRHRPRGRPCKALTPNLSVQFMLDRYVLPQLPRAEIAARAERAAAAKAKMEARDDPEQQAVDTRAIGEMGWAQLQRIIQTHTQQVLRQTQEQREELQRVRAVARRAREQQAAALQVAARQSQRGDAAGAREITEAVSTAAREALNSAQEVLHALQENRRRNEERTSQLTARQRIDSIRETVRVHHHLGQAMAGVASVIAAEENDAQQSLVAPAQGPVTPNGCVEWRVGSRGMTLSSRCTRCSVVIPSGFLRCARTRRAADGAAVSEEYFHVNIDCLRSYHAEIFTAQLIGFGELSRQEQRIVRVLRGSVPVVAAAAAAAREAAATALENTTAAARSTILSILDAEEPEVAGARA